MEITTQNDKKQRFNRPHFDVALATTEELSRDDVRDEADTESEQADANDDVETESRDEANDADGRKTTRESKEEALSIALRETFPGSDPIGFYR